MYTVLVVDDDPNVLEVLAGILREPGYTVLTARDGYEAIGLLADRHVDLMITDMRMPGLDGAELGVQAKVMRPYIHIIYITGYAEFAGKVGNGRLIEKPIRSADLIQVVKQEMTGA